MGIIWKRRDSYFKNQTKKWKVFALEESQAVQQVAQRGYGILTFEAVTKPRAIWSDPMADPVLKRWLDYEPSKVLAYMKDLMFPWTHGYVLQLMLKSVWS